MRLLTGITAVVAIVLSVSVQAKDVSMDRILAEHRITVVTTEKPETVSRYMLDMGIRNPVTTTLTELMIAKRELKDGDSLLFAIDRNKARHLITQEEQLLPCRTSAIDPNEVILFAAKAQGRNGWDILISAPNEKWLRWELDRLTKSNLSQLSLVARGMIIERFRVKRLCIVSNDTRQMAADWIKAQTQPGKDAIDWEFYSADKWDGASDSGSDVLFILNRETLAEKTKDSLSPYLPKGAREWLADNSGAQDYIVDKQIITSDEGASHSATAVAAPGSRHLRTTLRQYSKLESIPESLVRNKLTDMRGYGRMVVVARLADRKAEADDKTLDTLAGNLTNALSAQTGFQCVNRQDLKELSIETYLNHIPDAKDAPGKGHVTAVAVLDLSSISAETTYAANEPRCTTSVLPEYDEPKPREPREPHPDDKPLFCAHTYDVVNGSRANDPHYIRDHNEWEHEKMPRYRRDLSRWERDKRDYEDSRRDHEMEWIVSVSEAQRVKITGNLRVYDLSSGDVQQVGKVVFSCSTHGNAGRDGVYSEDRVVVRGEDNRPRSPLVPESIHSVSDDAVISDALKDACDAAVSELVANTLLPIDVVEK